MDQGIAVLKPANMERSAQADKAILTGRVFSTEPLTEVIPSWNIQIDATSSIEVVLRPICPEGPGPDFILGRWSKDAAKRTSVNDQSNEFGSVETDILKLKRPAQQMDVVIAIEGDIQLKSFTLASIPKAGPLEPHKAAWGREMPITPLRQRDFEGGGVLCSPTCVSMVMGWWATTRSQPKWAMEVPALKELIWDPGWNGAGNWAFNTAIPGSLEGLEARVVRLRSIRDLELLIEAGVPVTCSVSRGRLKGKPEREENDGHLVVVAGFNATGDPVVNDPGPAEDNRRTDPRQDFANAWSESKNTSYLIHPEGWPLPGEPGPWPRPNL